MATLIVIGPNLRVREFTIDCVVTIGRHESNAIMLLEEKASRFHCRIVPQAGRQVIEDLDSANGVYVNGLKIKSQPLNHNDRIVIGATTIVFSAGPTYQEFPETRELVSAVSSAALAIVPEPGEKPEPAGRRLPRARRNFRRSGSSSLAFGLGFAFLALLGAAYLASQIIRQREAEEARLAAEEARTPARSAPLPLPEPARPKVETAPEPAPKPALPLKEQLAQALAVRDRALATGNLLGAKAALKTFLAGVAPGDRTSAEVLRAQTEFEQTLALIDEANQLALQQARAALEKNNFGLVQERCTSVLSNDPAGPNGLAARELLEQIDTRTAPLAEETRKLVFDAVQRGQLDEAMRAVEPAVGKLSGTRWGGDISALQLSLLAVTDFLEEFEAARAAREKAGQPVPAHFPSKKLEGTLAGVHGLNLELEAESARMKIKLPSLAPADLEPLLASLQLDNRQAELGCLWYLSGRREAAQRCSRRALDDFSAGRGHGRASFATLLATLVSDAKNIHIYDFSAWQQQTDWEALSGSWFTENEQYVLQSADGGETRLNPDKIGGAFPLSHARLSFDCAIRTPNAGWSVVCELGNENRALSVLIDADGIFMEDKTGARSARLPLPVDVKTLHVEASIEANEATLRVNGGAPVALANPRCSAAQGALSFQAHQCGVALDNVILRRAE